MAHPVWETGSERSLTDKTRKDKYDRAKENDMEIVSRVKDVAERLGVTMVEVALAWHFSKGVAAPIVGGSKVSHLGDALKAMGLRLDKDDVRYLEEPYRPHEVVGALPAPG